MNSPWTTLPPHNDISRLRVGVTSIIDRPARFGLDAGQSMALAERFRRTAKPHTVADIPPQILDRRRRCPACGVRYMLPELRQLTGERCWTCAMGDVDSETKAAVDSAPDHLADEFAAELLEI